jgi:hypothetical protein
MKRICAAKNVQLSATLRLHQVKYRIKTGLPPVNRCALMFYNMGRVDTADENMSILDLGQAEKYTAAIKNYPLPLDVALPVFSWGLQMRSGKTINVLHNFNAPEAEQLPYLKSEGERVFRCDSNLFYHGLYLKQGDIVKTEQAEHDEILKAEKIMQKVLPSQNRTLILFDINPYTLKQYDPQQLEDFYTHLN